MPIPDIRLNNIRIRDVVIYDVPAWLSSDPPVALPAMPPVTTEVGTPIVNTVSYTHLTLPTNSRV